jgi:hypothetical protein
MEKMADNKKNKELNVLLQAAGLLDDNESDERTITDIDTDDDNSVTDSNSIDSPKKKRRHAKLNKDRANRQIQWDYYMLHLPRGKIPGVPKSHARKEAAQRLNLPEHPPTDWNRELDPSKKINFKTSQQRTRDQKARKDAYNRQLQWDLHVLGIRPGKVEGTTRTQARQSAAQRLGQQESPPVGWQYNNSKRSQKPTSLKIPLPTPNIVVSPPRVAVSIQSKSDKKTQKDAYNRQLQWDLHILGIPAGRVPHPGRSFARKDAAERLGVSENPPNNWKYIPTRYK